MEAPPASFRTVTTRAMRRRGVNGPAAVARCDGARLILDGEQGGSLAISVSAVARLRVSAQPGKVGPVYETHIWSNDGEPCLTLHPLRGESGYGAVVRAFAAAVERSSGRGRIETGSSRFDALFLPVSFGIVGSLLVAVAWSMADGPLWEPMIPTAIGAAIEALLVWDCLNSRWPRKAAGPASLAPYLP